MRNIMDSLGCDAARAMDVMGVPEPERAGFARLAGAAAKDAAG